MSSGVAPRLNNCVAQAAQFRELATKKISERLDMFQAPQRLADFFIESPLFTQAQLANGLRLSPKLGSRYIDTLRKNEIVDAHPSPNTERHFRCPISVGYWRQVMEGTASSSTQLLPHALSSSRP